jgi:hypothetical protein
VAFIKKYSGLFSLKLSTKKASTDIQQTISIHFSKKGKIGIAVALITIILVSSFIFYPKGDQTPVSPRRTVEPVANTNSTDTSNSNPTNSTSPTTSIITPSPTSDNPFQPVIDAINNKDRSMMVVTNSPALNSTVWKQIAAYSWNYFKPGTGVDSQTGLPASGDSVSYFTDWDLGVYLQAVIDANKTGLIGNEGAWGSSARIDKVVSFLENRDLNSAGYPYWFYQNDGKVYHEQSDKTTDAINIADTGRLFVALTNLKAFNATLTNRIDSFVNNINHNRSRYVDVVPAIKSESLTSTNIYAYYVLTGFASFWPDQLSDVQQRIVRNIMAKPTINTPENISLPSIRLTEDPILCSIFELNNNPSQLTSLARQAYLAHEAYYNATNGKYRAFGEGNTFSDEWAYEWIVYDNRTWYVTNVEGPSNMTPIIYTKVAFSFLALYNTTYARNMVMYIEDKMLNPTDGYSNGVDESGTLLGGTGLHTNGLILSAARYAIQNNP